MVFPKVRARDGVKSFAAATIAVSATNLAITEVELSETVWKLYMPQPLSVNHALNLTYFLTP